MGYEGNVLIANADSFHYVTKEELLEIQGPRVPAFPNAQKDFYADTIILHTRPLRPLAFALYDFMMREYALQQTEYTLNGITFFEATGGRASIRTRREGQVGLQVLMPPLLVSPLDNTTNVSEDESFSWFDVSGASTYHFQLASDSVFSNLVFEDSTLVNTTLNLGALDPGTIYFGVLGQKTV